MQKSYCLFISPFTDITQPFARIENLSARYRGEGEEQMRVDVVGPVCETADTFARAIPFPRTVRGDILAIRSAGAYGKMMSSSYNLRDATPVVYSDELR